MVRFKRGKRRLIADKKVGDIYKHYKDKTLNPVSAGQFFKILQMYWGGTDSRLGMFEEMIRHNIQIRLPNRLGTIYITRFKKIPKFKSNGDLDKTTMNVDWDKTLKLWETKYPGKTVEELKLICGKKLIYNLNEHTNMYTVMFNWDRITSNVPNQFFYNLNINRPYKVLLAKLLKEDTELINSYYERSGFRKVNRSAKEEE